jgi:hypothetical protein
MGDRISVSCWGDPMDETQLEGLGVDGRIILTWILKKFDGGMNWIDLA